MRHNRGILFKDWQWGESLEYLNNIIHHSDNIILVSGVTDSGKTTLKQEIINSLPVHCKSFSTSGESSRSNLATFMRQITMGFGLPWDNNLQPDWDELRRAIFYQPECNWILLVDDAEKLSWDLLSSLIDLYITISSEGSKFSLIFFADLSLQNNIKNSPLKDFFELKFQIVNLECLSFEQMTIFLYDHMQLNFDRKTLKKIYSASNGVIGKVKQLAISELNIQNTEKNNMLKKIIENIINPPVIRVAVCVGLLFTAYMVFYITQKQYPSTTTIALNTNKDLQPVKAIEEKIALDPSELVPSNSNLAIDNLATADTTRPNNTNGDINNTTMNSSNNLAYNQEQEVQYSQLYQKLYKDLKDNFQEQLVQLKDQVDQLHRSKSLLGNNIINRSNGLTSNKDKARSLVGNNKFNKFKTSKVIDQQLLNVPKKFYVLQLMASKNERTAKNLIKDYPELLNKPKYFAGKFKPDADLWYIVIYGTYSNPELALKDIKKLPINLQKLKPLVRDYGSIHKLIENNQ